MADRRAEGSNKRKAECAPTSDGGDRRSKNKKQYRHGGREGAPPFAKGASIEVGDAGIWATCERNKEAACVTELRDLFEEHARKLYGLGSSAEDGSDDDGDGGDADIAADIAKELESMRKPAQAALFKSVKLDTPCVVFFKTSPPVEPVSFVHSICEEAAKNPDRKRGRYVKRLVPMTLMGKATESGLEEVAAKVLAPHFYGEGNAGKKFAIRPNLRNHKTVPRDVIIRKVAATVGEGHKVDLKDYDLLIIVEMYKNMCGMSVVPNDFDRLKRYNLSEIYEPSRPQDQAPEASS